MIYLLYVAMAVVSLPITLLALILAPVLPLFASNVYGWCDNGSYQEFGPRLPSWLNWFQTPDNSLYGDSSFIVINGQSYWSQVKWLLRNPAYAYGLLYLTDLSHATWTGDNTIKDNDNAKEGWCLVHAGGVFQYTFVRRIGSTSRCIYVNLGWNIRALVDPNVNPRNPYEATFVFSPRISGFR